MRRKVGRVRNSTFPFVLTQGGCWASSRFLMTCTFHCTDTKTSLGLCTWRCSSSDRTLWCSCGVCGVLIRAGMRNLNITGVYCFNLQTTPLPSAAVDFSKPKPAQHLSPGNRSSAGWCWGVSWARSSCPRRSSTWGICSIRRVRNPPRSKSSLTKANSLALLVVLRCFTHWKGLAFFFEKVPSQSQIYTSRYKFLGNVGVIHLPK